MPEKNVLEKIVMKGFFSKKAWTETYTKRFFEIIPLFLILPFHVIKVIVCYKKEISTVELTLLGAISL